MLCIDSDVTHFYIHTFLAGGGKTLGCTVMDGFGHAFVAPFATINGAENPEHEEHR